MIGVRILLSKASAQTDSRGSQHGAAAPKWCRVFPHPCVNHSCSRVGVGTQLPAPQGDSPHPSYSWWLHLRDLNFYKKEPF